MLSHDEIEKMQRGTQTIVTCRGAAIAHYYASMMHDGAKPDPVTYPDGSKWLLTSIATLANGKIVIVLDQLMETVFA